VGSDTWEGMGVTPVHVRGIGRKSVSFGLSIYLVTQPLLSKPCWRHLSSIYKAQEFFSEIIENMGHRDRGMLNANQIMGSSFLVLLCHIYDEIFRCDKNLFLILKLLG
jgi:hypothetical protein